MKKIFDVFFFLRPILLIPVWSFFCLGYLRHFFLSPALPPGAVMIGSLSLPLFLWIPLRAAAVFAVLSVLMAGCYAFNQICDYEVDRQNVRGTLLTAGLISRPFAWFLCLAAAAVTLGSMLFFPRAINLLLLAALALSVLYSLPPVALTGRPFADFLANAAGYGAVAFGLGWYSFPGGGEGATAGLMLRSSLPYFCLMAAGSISSTLPDVPGDRKQGKITTAVFLGEVRAAWIAICFLGLTMLLGLKQGDLVAVVSAVVSLPFFLRFAITGKREHGIQCYQLGGGLFLIIAFLFYPLLLVLSLAIIFSTRWYHQWRLGWKYPNLGE